MGTAKYGLTYDGKTFSITLDVAANETVLPNRTIHIDGTVSSFTTKYYFLEFRIGTHVVNRVRMPITSTASGSGKITGLFTLSKGASFYWPNERRSSISLYMYSDRGVDERRLGETVFYLLREALSPKIEALDIYRCDASGTRTDEGVYLRCGLLRLSRGADAETNLFSLKRITIAQIGASTSSTLDLPSDKLTAAFSSEGYRESGYGASSLFYGKTYSNGNSYTLTLELGDEYEKAEMTIDISRAFANLHLSGAPDGGVAIGKYSSATKGHPLFEVAEGYESHFYGPTRAEGGIYGVTNYDSGEIATGGHWIDGKPIYRYTWTGSWKCTGSNSVVCTLPSKVDNIINIRGWLDRGDGNQRPMFNGLTSIGYGWAFNFRESDNALIGVGGSSMQHTYTVRVAVDYTINPASDPASPEGPEIFDDPPYADAGVARADYVAMMTGIEIPIDSDSDTMHDESQPIDPPGVESEPTPVHSKKFDLVQLYFLAEVWNDQMVNAAVDRWITEKEAAEILGTNDTLERM